MADDADNSTVESIVEFADSRGLSLAVDREKGVIPGVKIIGLESINGRTYSPAALRNAIRLYEGARVNVNHPAGAPTTPRDYRDRIGHLKNVREESGGLRGDLHFNPKHALAEQLAWDAENSPENVGLSHNVAARTTRRNGKLFVEEITKVNSVDLVADPATTRGLREGQGDGDPPTDRLDPTGRSRDLNGLADDKFAAVLPGGKKDKSGKTTPRSLRRWPLHNADAVRASITSIRKSKTLAGDAKKAALRRAFGAAKRFKISLAPVAEGKKMDLADITLEEIQAQRPDLLEEHAAATGQADELKTLREEIKQLKEEKAKGEKLAALTEEIKAAGLDAANQEHAPKFFMEQLGAIEDAAARKAMLEDRKTLLEAAGKLKGKTATTAGGGQTPKSQSQLTEQAGAATTEIRDPKALARAWAA